jgi:hypothetical protein
MFRHAALQLSSATLAVCVLVISLNVATVEASTVERVQRLDPFGLPYDSYYLEYSAAPGEANDLEIRLGLDGVTLRETGRALTATGCAQVDASTAQCLYGDPLTVSLADGDDVARIVDTRPPETDPDPPVARGPQVRIEAGTGADSITGGPGDEAFTDGGAGEADRFAGGGGTDRVSYAGRREPVRITVGAPGEDVLAGIETLQGGSGDDVLTGDGRPNELWGGPGKDILRGLGGGDDLDGDGGSDRLYGGAGNDALSGDSYTSGLGRDLLEGGRGDDFLDLRVEDDESLSVGGPTFDTAADHMRDTARGGAGYDVVSYPDDEDTVRSCEAATLGDTFTFARSLRRLSRTRVRLRVGVVPGLTLSEVSRVVVLTPRGRSGPRLSKPVRIRIDDAGRVSLRLTPAGVRYLRRSSDVTITSPDLDETIDTRVLPRRSH